MKGRFHAVRTSMCVQDVNGNQGECVVNCDACAIVLNGQEQDCCFGEFEFLPEDLVECSGRPCTSIAVTRVVGDAEAKEAGDESRKDAQGRAKDGARNRGDQSHTLTKAELDALPRTGSHGPGTQTHPHQDGTQAVQGTQTYPTGASGVARQDEATPHTIDPKFKPLGKSKS